ncbi:MAG TPA: alpha/beta hydrolase, partial [Fibrobacteria bacterium]|nr:alpha/beta hydrolase [Fibrobacteria bacterium]
MSRPALPAFLFVLLLAAFASAQDTVRVVPDTTHVASSDTVPIVPGRLPDATFIYARIDTTDLKLDLYLPPNRRPDTSGGLRAFEALPPMPFVLWLHGGGWRGGTRADPCPAMYLLDSGYAVISADYRLSASAPWPAQIHDAKAALRWLRAHVDSLNLDSARGAAWGTSAGGQLAALLGLTTPADSLDGRVGVDSGATPAPTKVGAVVMYHAPTDFLEFHPRRWKRGSSISQLLGCPVPDCPVAARHASPAAYVDSDDPPVFLAHGTADSTVPVTQAYRM